MCLKDQLIHNLNLFTIATEKRYTAEHMSTRVKLQRNVAQKRVVWLLSVTVLTRWRRRQPDVNQSRDLHALDFSWLAGSVLERDIVTGDVTSRSWRDSNWRPHSSRPASPDRATQVAPITVSCHGMTPSRERAISCIRLSSASLQTRVKKLRRWEKNILSIIHFPQRNCHSDAVSGHNPGGVV